MPCNWGKKLLHQNTIYIVQLRTPPIRDNSTEIEEKLTQASV